MPESVRDRPTKAHEYLFLLSKSERYFYDDIAIKEDASSFGRQHTSKVQPPKVVALVESGHHGKGGDLSINYERESRNKRSVWSVATRPFKGAHFATFPPNLIEPCVLAGTSEAGCCPACGKPWERVVERGEAIRHKPAGNGPGADPAGSGEHRARRRSDTSIFRTSTTFATVTIGFRPACPCVAGGGRYWCEDCFITADIADLTGGCPKCGETMTPAPHQPIPCTVHDPFAGVFTTGVVAKQHGRSFLGIELNPAYLEMGRERLANTPSPLPGMLGPRPTFEATA